jgi:membrane fusion protein
MANVAYQLDRSAAKSAPPSERAPVNEPLFRPEVLAERRTQWLGTVLLEPRTSSSVLVLGALLAVAAVLALLFFGTFSSKARLNGWLVPDQGVVRVLAPQTGVITRIHVQEGIKVSKGTPLISLSGEIQSESLGATKAEVVRRLLQRRNSLHSAMEIQQRIFDQQATNLSQRLAIMMRDRRYLVTDVALLTEQARLNEDAMTRSRRNGSDFSARYSNNPKARSYIDAESRNYFDLGSKLQTAKRNKNAHERELLDLQAEMQALPLRRQNQLAEIARGLAAVEQELAEAEARRQIVVTAPQEGIVTGIQTEPGGSANPNIPLMTIVPANSVLQAHLFGTSRAIGFVREGQRVLLRYHAFPYQKFGQYEGVIRSISRSAVSPTELTQQLSGLTSLHGTSEPLYKITVDLLQQTAMAYGEPVLLQAGMQLEADIMIESRRLFEWVLDPLYSLTGKIH